MSGSKSLFPIAARVGRSYRAQIVAAAERRGLSMSAFIKEALKVYFDPVNDHVNFPSGYTSRYPSRVVSRAEAPSRGGGFTETPIR